MKKIYYFTLVLFLFSKLLFAQNEAYMGEIRLTAFPFAPKNWALCQGQLLPINQYQALFSILGTTYGGNGTTNFALPDYRGRAAVGVDSDYVQGEKTGAESVALTATNLPQHAHIESVKVSNGAATLHAPIASSSIGAPAVVVNSTTHTMLGFNSSAPNVALAGMATTTAGSAGPTAINTMQPYLVLNYMICIQGLFPSQY
jgi:microcystin-dependent protein